MSVPPVVYDGVYGPYTVTGEHRREVLAYRLSLLLVALAQLVLLLQWRWLGPSWCWPWLLLMAAGLGGALRWVHIYLVPLHRALQLFWLLGCAGFGLLAYRAGAASMLPQLVDQPAWIWLVGPFFAALAGLGFKARIHRCVFVGFALNRQLQATGQDRLLLLLTQAGWISDIQLWMQ